MLAWEGLAPVAAVAWTYDVPPLTYTWVNYYPSQVPEYSDDLKIIITAIE